MAARPRAPRSGLVPGTDAISLWVITAMVLAGLVATGLRAAGSAFGGAGASLLRAAAAPAPRAPGGLARRRARDRRAQSAALGLLRQAASTARTADYQGVEVVVWRGLHGVSTAVAQVWHVSGAPALTGPAAGTPPPDVAGRQAAAPPADGAPSLDSSGALVISQRLTAMLAANYVLAVTGRGMVAGRPTRVLTVRHTDGTLAARIWLDQATHLPLRRQVFGARARLVSDVAFKAVAFGPRAVAGVLGAPPRPWGQPLAPAQLARLRARGWPLPGQLPGRLQLLAAREGPTPSGPVVDLDYSDGLCMVSVLVQRGHLPSRLDGWSAIAMDGHRVYADDPDDLSLAWSAGGYVYTLISAAPPQTVGEVVAALPHDDTPGLLARLERGVRRLLSLLRP